MTRLPVKALRDLPPGTLVRLPAEMGRVTGYAEGDGSLTVLVPVRQGVHGIELPGCALVEVIARPYELAHAYLRSDLRRIDRRWRPPGRSPRAGGPKKGQDEANAGSGNENDGEAA